MVVEFPARTESPGKFLGDEALGDRWGVYLATERETRFSRERDKRTRENLRA